MVRSSTHEFTAWRLLTHFRVAGHSWFVKKLFGVNVYQTRRHE